MTPCDGTPNSEKWCCGGSTDCCASNFIAVARSFGNSTTKTSSITISSSAPEALSSSSTSPDSLSFGGLAPTTSAAPISSTLPSSKPSGGIITGIVIGAMAVLTFVFTAGYVWAKRRRTIKGRISAAPSKTMEDDSSDTRVYYAQELSGTDSYVVEAQGRSISELHEQVKPQELA